MKNIVSEPLTTEIAAKETAILLNEIDRRIVKIRPMATPVDQISRWGGAQRSGSMIVDYYSVDTKPTTTVVSDDYVEPSASDVTQSASRATLPVENNDIFEVSETILVRGVAGYDEDGVARSGELILYVTGKDTNAGTINVLAVNGKKIGTVENCVPTIEAETELVRMGRAATELDVQTTQFEALPVKAQNFCQIFKMQIEQSTLMKIANKEVAWDFSDQEESAIYDMRLGMEKNYLFGVRRKIYDPVKREPVMLTGGIWRQAGKEFKYNAANFSQDTLIDIMKEAFTGNAGSRRKILIAGSDLVGRINKMETTKLVSAGENVVKWGIDFNEIRSKFGTLYVLLSEVFDECGMSNNGIIIDPEYIRKYSHIPFNTEQLDLKAAGVRNTDAIVITEASCVVLRYPSAHMRVVMN